MKIKQILFMIFIMASWVSYSQAPSNGLIASYLFNGNVEDDSGANNNGTIHGGCAYIIDRFGNDCGAMAFNGSNGYISVPNSSTLSSPRNELTISIWFKTTQGQNSFKWITAICKGNNRKEKANSPHYRLQITSKTLSINTEFTEKKTLRFIDNYWYHYALTYDGQNVKTYLDGKVVFEYAFDEILFSNNAPLLIGRDAPGSDEYFKGALDEIKIYNRSLSLDEISDIYHDEFEYDSKKECEDEYKSADLKKDKDSRPRPIHIMP